MRNKWLNINEELHMRSEISMHIVEGSQLLLIDACWEFYLLKSFLLNIVM